MGFISFVFLRAEKFGKLDLNDREKAQDQGVLSIPSKNWMQR